MAVGPGSLVADRFEVVRALARGGMADLYEALDKTNGKRVALKVLREELSKDPEVLARFDREARAAGAVHDPNVAEVFECGVTERNRPFIVMELLEGNDLARELDMRGVLPADEAVRLMVEACQGMIAAHEAGIVHRDLKPSNLFLAHEGGQRVLKVLDFGISKFVAAADEHVTLTKALFGSPLYMSPEQFRSAKSADQRSDVWSLGVIFYEILTGLPPFVAENAPAVGLAITREPHMPPTERRPSLPKKVDAVIAGALQKNPAHRYQTMKELLRALEDLLPRGRDDTPTRLNALVVPTIGSVRPPRIAEPGDPPTQLDRGEANAPTRMDLARELTSTAATLPAMKSSVPPPQVPSRPPSNAPSKPASTPPPDVTDASRASEPRSFALSTPAATAEGSAASPSASPPALSFAPPARKRGSRLVWAGVGVVAVLAFGAFLASRPATPADPAPALGASPAEPPKPTAETALPPSQPSGAPAPVESVELDSAPTGSATEVDELPAAKGTAKPRTGKPKPKPKPKPGLFNPSGI